MGLKTVYLIQETDLEHENLNTVAVCSSVEKSHEIMRDYYGSRAKYFNYRDIRDSNLEYSIDVFVDGYEYLCTVVSYDIDKL